MLDKQHTTIGLFDGRIHRALGLFPRIHASTPTYDVRISPQSDLFKVKMQPIRSYTILWRRCVLVHACTQLEETPCLAGC